MVWEGNQVAAVLNPPWSWQALAAAGNNMESLLLSCVDLPRLTASLTLMSYPHEVIAANMRVFAENMQMRIDSAAYRQTEDGVFLASDAQIGAYIVFDTKAGPIIIDSQAQVGPYTLLRGPLYIGPRAKILEHAAIKDAVSLGHTTKVGGEVEAAVVEPTATNNIMDSSPQLPRQLDQPGCRNLQLRFKEHVWHSEHGVWVR